MWSGSAARAAPCLVIFPNEHFLQPGAVEFAIRTRNVGQRIAGGVSRRVAWTVVNTPSDLACSAIGDMWSLLFMHQLLAISQLLQHSGVEITMPTTISSTAGY